MFEGRKSPLEGAAGKSRESRIARLCEEAATHRADAAIYSLPLEALRRYGESRHPRREIIP